jgi:hypothetical protein
VAPRPNDYATEQHSQPAENKDSEQREQWSDHERDQQIRKRQEQRFRESNNAFYHPTCVVRLGDNRVEHIIRVFRIEVLDAGIERVPERSQL